MDILELGKPIYWLMSDLLYMVWFYLEYPIYLITDFTVNNLYDLLNWVSNNFTITVLLILLLPFGYKFFKELLVTAYKMVFN